nr:hypothetical protein [Tanacetum cinerariifolium]
TVRYVRTDNGTEFVNHTMTEYYERIDIFYQKTVPKTPQQNGVVERQNRTLVEAARTMLIFSKALMFLWAEAVATACYTQNPDTGIFVGYAPIRKGYRIYNKRTSRIMETIHVQFDELTEPMAPVHLSTGTAPTFLTPGHISSGLPMFDEYLEPPRAERPGSPAHAVQAPVTSAGTPLSTTIDQDAPSLHISPSSSALQSHSLPQGIVAEPHFMEDHNVAPVDNNPLVNVFAPEPHFEASSSGDISSTESPYVSQSLHHLNKWSKDHPLDNVIGNPSRPVSTQKQLATDALCKGSSSALSISKMKAASYPDFGLELLVPEHMWIDDVCTYDINAKYGISHWWFNRQKFYIDIHDSLSRRKEVRSHMRILSVVRIKAYSRYNMYPSDFEVLNLLLLQGHLDHLHSYDKRMLSTAVKLWTRNLVIRQRVEDFQFGIESNQIHLNLTKLGCDATGYEFKHDYTIIESPRAVVFPVNNNEQKIMRFNKIYKFSDGTLTQILEALAYRVKEFKIKRLNPGMNTRFWTQKDVTRSKDFTTAIERRQKTIRIYRNLKCFVGRRFHDIDY